DSTSHNGDTNTNATAAIPVSLGSISPPYVTDVPHAALRQEYEEAIEARCGVTGEVKGKALRSIKTSFNRQSRSTLCKLEWGTTVEAVSYDRFAEGLNKIVGNVMNNAILKLWTREIVRARTNVSVDGQTQASPGALRNAGKSKSDDDQGSRHDNQRGSRKAEKVSERPRSVQIQENPILAAQSKPRIGCFHFGKAHRLCLCPDLDEPSAKETILRVDVPSTTNRENGPTVTINRALKLPYCADSGWDMNSISRKHVDLLCEQDLAVVLAELDAQITSRADEKGLHTSTH
ncbi:hypothetical protein GN958_ATG03490, partial [Phytophthora infestans]